MSTKGAKQALVNANDPLALTGGSLTGRRVLDPLNVLPGNGRSVGRTALDPLGVFGGGRKPGNLGPTGTRVPDWQRGVKGAGVNPAAAQNPMNNPQAQATGGRGMFGRVAGVLQQAQQNRAPSAGPSGMLQGIAARRAALGGGAPAGAAPQAGQVRMYSDGGKVFDRKPNGKRC